MQQHQMNQQTFEALCCSNDPIDEETLKESKVDSGGNGRHGGTDHDRKVDLDDNQPAEDRS